VNVRGKCCRNEVKRVTVIFRVNCGRRQIYRVAVTGKGTALERNYTERL